MKCELCEVKEIEDVVDPVHQGDRFYTCESCNKILRLTQVTTREQFELVKKAMKDKDNPLIMMEDEEKIVVSCPNMEGFKKPNAILEVNMEKEEALPIRKYIPVGAKSANKLGLEVHLIGKKNKETGIRNYVVVAKFNPPNGDKEKHVLEECIVQPENVDEFMNEMGKKIGLYFLYGELGQSGCPPMGMDVIDVDAVENGMNVER